MTIVEDDGGRRYLLIKRSSSASLLQSLDTGDQAYHPNKTFRVITDGHSGEPIPEEVLTLIGDTDIESTDDRFLEVLTVLARGEPVPIRSLLDLTTLCESDLFAILRELEVRDIVETTTIGAEPARQLTADAEETINQS